MKAYVVRTLFGDTSQSKEFWQSLRSGIARIGWSYSDDLDLRAIVEENKQGRWHMLTPAQQEAWYCHGFVDRAEVGDLLFYPDVPESGKFVVAKVTDGYSFLPAKDAIGGDFRSARKCELVTSLPISRSDGIVHPWLCRRLGLQGRFYELYDEKAVEFTLDRYRAGQAGQTEADVRDALEELMESIAKDTDWSRFFPGAKLSNILASIFEERGYSVQLTEGPAERGSDLVVTIEDELLANPIVVGIQVGSYLGDVSPGQVRRKLRQLLNGWEVNHLDSGVLILAGKCGADARQVVEDHNKENAERKVKILDGSDLARTVLLRNSLRRAQDVS